MANPPAPIPIPPTMEEMCSVPKVPYIPNPDVLPMGVQYVGYFPGRSRRGPCDTPQMIQSLARDNPLTRGFIGHFLYSAAVTYNQQNISYDDRSLIMLQFTVGRARMLERRDEDDIKLMLVGEILAPFIPADRRDLDPWAALKNTAVYMLTHQCNMYVNGASYQVGVAPPVVLPWEGENAAADAAEALPGVWDGLAFFMQMRGHLRVSYGNWIRDLAIEWLVCVCTRGHTTDAKLSRLASSIDESVGYEPSLSSDRIALYYRAYGRFLTPENVRLILTTWLQNIPEDMLTLRLIINQASYAGLTHMMAIGMAIAEHPNFPWLRLSTLFTGQFAAFQTAKERVGENPFYGYTRDLQDVAARTYKDLAFACKELLIRGGGHDSLKAYGGWGRSCKNHQTVLAMIETYLANNADIALGAVDPIDPLVSDLVRGIVARPGMFHGEAPLLEPHNIGRGEAFAMIAPLPGGGGAGGGPNPGAAGVGGGGAANANAMEEDGQEPPQNPQ